ncbi:hypothetical protein KAJ77_00075, partial [bacterium]|nr:hypothetical protein [bacterium]
AVSFCDLEERPYLKDIERLIGQKVPVEEAHPWHVQGAVALKSMDMNSKGERARNNRNGQGKKHNPSSSGKGSRRNPSPSGHRGNNSSRYSAKSESESAAHQRHR